MRCGGLRQRGGGGGGGGGGGPPAGGGGGAGAPTRARGARAMRCDAMRVNVLSEAEDDAFCVKRIKW